MMLEQDMAAVSVDDFKNEKKCIYGGEQYSVRDNGAVLRHTRATGRKRTIDNIWTFGEPNLSNPYLHIASVRVHRIVATAFHGWRRRFENGQVPPVYRYQGASKHRFKSGHLSF